MLAKSLARVHTLEVLGYCFLLPFPFCWLAKIKDDLLLPFRSARPTKQIQIFNKSKWEATCWTDPAFQSSGGKVEKQKEEQREPRSGQGDFRATLLSCFTSAATQVENKRSILISWSSSRWIHLALGDVLHPAALCLATRLGRGCQLQD